MMNSSRYYTPFPSCIIPPIVCIISCSICLKNKGDVTTSNHPLLGKQLQQPRQQGLDILLQSTDVQVQVQFTSPVKTTVYFS
mmetsp:Transcript_22986/g.38480  ORF Transcript_22986/g.38480 Transcript_22986/m.38480 type:complete len:82 (+) Transcript_22986:854-1099(+)